MEANNKATSNYKPLFILLTAVVLFACIVVGSVAAWLQVNYLHESDDDLKLGSVALGLYGNGTLIEGTTTEENGVTHWECNIPYDVPGNQATRTLDLKVRNIGTIRAILRATIRVYVKDSNVTLLLSTTPTVIGSTMSCSMTTPDWILNFPENNSVAGGEMFYNKQIKPYVIDGENQETNEVSIISNITLPEEKATTQLCVQVTLDAVAYSGNIYKKQRDGKLDTIPEENRAYPFGTYESLPEDWTAYYIEN